MKESLVNLSLSFTPLNTQGVKSDKVVVTLGSFDKEVFVES